MGVSSSVRVRFGTGIISTLVLLLLGGLPSPAPVAANTLAGPTSTVAFGIFVPVSATPNRAPAFVRARPLSMSPPAQSLTILTDGSNALSVNLLPNAPGCRATTAGLVCTAALRVAPVTHVFSVATYGRPNSTGNVLSLNSTGPVVVNATGVTYVPLTLEGAASGITLTLAVPDPDAGAPLTIALNAVIRDAYGNIIVGSAPFVNAIRLSTNDGANARLSKTILGSPADETGLTVTYSGAKTGSITFGATAAGLTTVAAAPLTPRTWTESILYSFPGRADGSSPKTELLADASGALYGTTVEGVVFKLTPPVGAATAWKHRVIGKGPNSRLVADAHGTLYGTADYCSGTCLGSVYELIPGASGYTSHQVYAFRGGSDGDYPRGGLTFDRTGALYGTTGVGGTGGSGTVFKLTPTPAGYRESVIHTFAYIGDGNEPDGGVIVDATGTLYGTTENGPTIQGPGTGPDDGTVFALSPGAGGYTENLLYEFGGEFTADARYPASRLLAGSGGVFYGTTRNGGMISGPSVDDGTVFELTPISGVSYYNETLLHSFSGGADGASPIGGVVADANGSLYGTTDCGGIGGGPRGGCPAGSGVGIAFRLIPTPSGYKEEIIHNFNVRAGDGTVPYAGLILDSAGNAYGTTTGGGAYGLGTVFELKHVKCRR